MATRSIRVFLVLILSLLMASTAIAGAAPESGRAPVFVIGGQYAFDAEGAYVIEQMQQAPGTYFTVDLPTGRTLHVLDFADYPGVRFVYAGTRRGIVNAASLSTMMANLPASLRPDVVIHSGIAGNAGDGDIGDIYLNSYFVLANLVTVHPDHIQPRIDDSYDPGLDEPTGMVYYPADQRLIQLGQAAFEKYSSTNYFQGIQARFRTPDRPVRVLTGYVGASSNWFVASSEVQARWETMFDVRPAQGEPVHPGEVFYESVGERLPLGTIDMETAAAAKVFYEHGIPFAAARYPSDGAGDTARSEIEEYRLLAADLGGGFVWQWVQSIAADAAGLMDGRPVRAGFPAVGGSRLHQLHTATGKELVALGDLGISLMGDGDGVMIGVDGEFYRTDAEGNLYALEPGDRLSSVFATRFIPSRTHRVGGGMTMEQLQLWLTRQLPNPDTFYVLKVTGNFRSVVAGSRPGQADAAATWAQVASGVMVGYLAPVDDVDPKEPRLYLHFVAADRTKGGHVLDFETSEVILEIMEIDEVRIKLQ